jgi:dTDP-D-glucose 4,6-dehydratase
MLVCFAVAQGETGEVYNIGTEKERTVKEVCQCFLLMPMGVLCCADYAQYQTPVV